MTQNTTKITNILPFRSAAGDALPGAEGDSHLQLEDIPLLLGVLLILLDQ